MKLEISYYLLLALATVESNNEPEAINREERAYGILQIRQPVLDDVNKKHGLQLFGFTLSDCLNPRTSQFVFKLYINMWATESRLGRIPTDEDIARIWNGGPNGHKKASTIPYWLKVKKELDKFKGYYEYTENTGLFD